MNYTEAYSAYPLARSEYQDRWQLAADSLSGTPGVTITRGGGTFYLFSSIPPPRRLYTSRGWRKTAASPCARGASSVPAARAIYASPARPARTGSKRGSPAFAGC
jgi:aspartate/methionine/tyrosine aminotransferase